MTNGSDDCMAKTEGFVFLLNTDSEKELIKNHSTVGVLLTAKKNELLEQLICFFPLPALKTPSGFGNQAQLSLPSSAVTPR